MKFNKIFSILGLTAAMAFTACTDSVEYTPAPQEETPGVYFPDVEISDFALDANSTAQVITISRKEVGGEVTVGITATGDTDKFSVPASVTFAGGAETAVINITPLVDQMVDFTTYKLALTIAPEYSSDYLVNTWEGTFVYANSKEWVSLGMCVYTDDMVGPLFSNPCFSWEVEIEEHTNTPGLYRLVNPYGCEDSPFARYCKLEENYIIVDATNPAKVFFGEDPNDGFTTGVDMGYGIMTIGLQAFGTYADGKITWPVKGLAIFDDDGGYYANQSGKFCIDLSDLVD
ncbi:MAG: hypothetical protein K2H84_02480 [Paramuribaculum sp.]|nr:hypothetical protein [Paramuribaculum sp.]